MKKMFLACMTTALVSSAAFAQTSASTVAAGTKVKKASTTAVVAPSAAPVTIVPVTTSTTTASGGGLVGHLKEKLRIRYFSETLTSSIKKFDDHQVDPKGNPISDPVNVFNIISFNYNFGQKVNFIFNPRFTTQLGDRSQMGASEDKGVIQLDDFMTGFAGTVYTNGKFEYFVRPTVRLTTSKFSRDQHTNAQYDFFHDIGYQFTKKFRVDLWNSFRYYDNYGAKSQERYRVYFAPFLDYALNDKWHVNVEYEYEIQHRNAKSGQPGHRPWYYTKRNYADVYVGLAYNVSQNLSITPFLKFLDQGRIRNDNTIVALWVSATLF